MMTSTLRYTNPYWRFLLAKKTIPRVVLFVVTLVLIASPLKAHDVVPNSPVSPVVRTLRIGALANRGTDECLKRWQPTAVYLERHIPGTRFEIVPLGFDGVSQKMAEGRIHFIITNPAQYSALEFAGKAYRIAGFLVPSARGPQRVYGGVIFTRSDRRDIRSISDLKGKRFTAVDAESLGGWLCARRELQAAGIDPYRDFATLRFAGTHDGAVRSVLSGASDAGTARSSQLEAMAARGEVDLRALRVIPGPYPVPAGYPFLLSTRLYPEWPFAVVEGTDEDLSRKVAVSLMTMAPDDPAAKASGGSGWTIPSDYSSVHALLRELHLDPYRNAGKITPGMILSAYWPHLLAVLAALLLISFFALRASILNRRLQGSMTELSQRTKALDASREALQIERDNLAAIFKAMADGIYIADSEAGILYVNSALESDFGPCKGRSCFEYLYERTEPCPWCHIPDVTAGKTVRWEQFFPKNGKTYDIIETPLRKADGIVKLTIFRDITERSRAESALRESRELLNAIVEGTSDSIFVKDAEGRFRLFNSAACRNTGRSAAEVIGRDVAFLFSDPEAKVCMEMDRSLMADPGTVTYEEEFTLNGERRVFLTTKGTLTDDRGAASGIFGISRDITDLRRMEAERLEMERRLLHSQKLESLGVLAGGIAHDFNNLLAVILGNLDMTLMRVPSDSPAQHNIEAAIKACQRAAKLIGQMLDYAGKGRFVLRDIDLNEVVLDNASLLRTSVGRNIELAIATTPGLPGIKADQEQIQQVIMNLIINAAEAIGDGPGIIDIGTGMLECDDDYLFRSRVEEKPAAGRFVYLEVSDTGCGMDGETQARLFEPFYTTKFMGRGLGMSAVLGIVRAHGGAIMLDSRKGRGTVFRILFPGLGAADARTPEIAAPEERSGAPRAGRGTVLVVDDEQDVRDLCMEIVEYLGFTAIGAADGNEALRIFGELTSEIGLVVLDMTMPNLDGVGAFYGLRRIRPDVDVVISSGYSEDDVSRHFTGDRPSGFLQKPFKVEELRAILSRVSRARSVPYGGSPEQRK